MNLVTGLCLIVLFFLIFKLLYKPYSKNLKAKKLQKQQKEEHFKQQLLNYHPGFNNLYSEFKLDQEEKREKGYNSDLMISEGGYVSKIYGQSIFVYDEYFENCFHKKFETKYNELINNPDELEKVMKLIPQRVQRKNC